VPEQILVIACGALAREINDLKRSCGWHHLSLKCIDAQLHNRPALIPDRLREEIRRHKHDYDQIFVAYADCGTGGAIDAVLEAEGIERLPGAHCYQFYAGAERFAALAKKEPGTFYLTDFLARHFERLVIKPLQLDVHPQLRDAYFGNYRRLVFLSQTDNEFLLAAAINAAKRLSLDFEHVNCGYGALETNLRSLLTGQTYGQKDAHLLARDAEPELS
jgi:uncharacterized protein DUF1638